MERLTLTVILLAALNLAVWLVGGSFESPPSVAERCSRLAILEDELLDLGKTASWTARVSRFLDSPPPESPNDLLAALRALAAPAGFQIVDSVNDGGRPARIAVTGYGPYPAGALLANHLSRSPDIRVERVSCEIRDDGLVAFDFVTLIRAAPWEGTADPLERPEPVFDATTPPVIGRVDLFTTVKPIAPVSKSRPIFRYLGFFAEIATPTVILETNGRAFLARVGDILSGGVKILSAATDDIELYHHEVGTRTVRMKTGP